MNSSKQRNTTKNYFVFFTIVPILITCSLITIIASRIIVQSKNADTKVMLENSVNGLLACYQAINNGPIDFVEKDDGLYLSNGYKITGDNKLVDTLRSNRNIEFTIFKADERISTTILGSRGRYIGTKATDIWEDYCSKGEEYYSDNVKILDIRYYGYYKPIINSKNEIIGMAFSGIKASIIDVTIKRLRWSIYPLIVIAAFLGFFLAIFAASRITSLQNKIVDYAKDVYKGRSNKKIDEKILNRKDEFGMVARVFSELNTSLDALIQKDTLTGINNRRAALHKIENYVKKANCVDGEKFCLAIGDIDFFKRVNDTYGHNCGDEVLKKVAELIDVFPEDKGFVARWGGEEFLIVIKDSLENSIKLIENIHKAIGETVIEYQGKFVSVTMTLGVSEYRPPENLDVLISKADALLYKGKQEGRNKIVH